MDVGSFDGPFVSRTVPSSPPQSLPAHACPAETLVGGVDGDADMDIDQSRWAAFQAQTAEANIDPPKVISGAIVGCRSSVPAVILPVLAPLAKLVGTSSVIAAELEEVSGEHLMT